MKPVLSALALAAFAPPAASQEAPGRTVVEAMIAARNPCAALRTEIAGQTVGIDELEDIELRQADAALRGDDLALSLAGRLSCRTSDSALLQGDASAAVAASAEVPLADCEGATLTIALSDFGGSFAAVLQALEPVLEAQMAEAARPPLVEACRKLRGP